MCKRCERVWVSRWPRQSECHCPVLLALRLAATRRRGSGRWHSVTGRTPRPPGPWPGRRAAAGDSEPEAAFNFK